MEEEKECIIEVCRWICAMSPTQMVFESAPNRGFMTFRDFRPPPHTMGYASWRGMQLWCAARPAGRRHGVCGIVLMGGGIFLDGWAPRRSSSALFACQEAQQASQLLRTLTGMMRLLTASFLCR